MIRGLFPALVVACCWPAAVRADGPPWQPNLVALGAGYFDFDKTGGAKAADLRPEYRWGLSLLPLAVPATRGWDRFVQLHPYAGLEGNSNGLFYASGGLSLDIFATRHVVLTWTEGVGTLHNDGHDQLGSVLEFRSMVEAGWRFDNGMRLTAAYSHISNAGAATHDPGAEIVGLYVQIPVGWP